MSGNRIDWLAARIMDAANRAMDEKPAPRFNPRPPGVIREGSATKAVLDFLSAHPTTFFQHDQIVRATGRTGKAVDWALLFLRAQHRVIAREDTSRSARYLRYSIAKEGER